MRCPIVIAAFGTTSRARATYTQVDKALRRRFPGHDIHWAYTSRIIRHKLKNRSIDLPPPVDVLNRIASQDHKWAVVQSFNMICGHEFHRLKKDALHGPLRISLGHSLLCSPRDHSAVAKAMSPLFEKDDDAAVVLVGHGTDHCSWTVYPAFEQLLRQHYGTRAFVGVIEGDWPARESVIDSVQSAGFSRVRLVPLMLVAGIHAEEDLSGPGDSWKSALEARNIEVVIQIEGLGANPQVIDIFIRHIQSALDVIPRDV